MPVLNKPCFLNLHYKTCTCRTQKGPKIHKKLAVSQHKHTEPQSITQIKFQVLQNLRFSHTIHKDSTARRPIEQPSPTQSNHNSPNHNTDAISKSQSTQKRRRGRYSRGRTSPQHQNRNPVAIQKEKEKVVFFVCFFVLCFL